MSTWVMVSFLKVKFGIDIPEMRNKPEPPHHKSDK